MIDTQLTLDKILNLEFNVVKVVIWMVENTILFTFYSKFKVLELPVCKAKGEQKLLIYSLTVRQYAVIHGTCVRKNIKSLSICV